MRCKQTLISVFVVVGIQYSTAHFVGQFFDNGCVLANVFSRVVQLLFCVQFHEYLVYVVYTLSHNNI